MDEGAGDATQTGSLTPDAASRRGCFIPAWFMMLAGVLVAALLGAGAVFLVMSDDVDERRSVDTGSGTSERSASTSTSDPSTSSTSSTSSTTVPVTTTVKSGSGAGSSGGSGAKKTTTTTKKPPPPTIDSFYALPNPAQCDSSLVANITLTFSWTTSHATETKITAFPQTFGPDASTSTAVACGTFDVQYSLMATGPGGTTQNSIQISVVDGRG